MKLTSNILFKNFKVVNSNKIKIKKLLFNILNSKNEILDSLKKKYKYSFDKQNNIKLKNFSNIFIIGMGGSILGAKSIYSFLKKKN